MRGEAAPLRFRSGAVQRRKGSGERVRAGPTGSSEQQWRAGANSRAKRARVRARCPIRTGHGFRAVTWKTPRALVYRFFGCGLLAHKTAGRWALALRPTSGDFAKSWEPHGAPAHEIYFWWAEGFPRRRHIGAASDRFGTARHIERRSAEGLPTRRGEPGAWDMRRRRRSEATGCRRVQRRPGVTRGQDAAELQRRGAPYWTPNFGAARTATTRNACAQERATRFASTRGMP